MTEKTLLDRTDVAIVRGLVEDARRTNRDLAAAVGLSPSACLERVRRLVDRGVITGHHAEVSPDAVGIGIEALLTVRLQRHTRSVIEPFQLHCDGLPEVVDWWHLTGGSDYQLLIAVRDHDHLRAFLMDSFTTRPEVGQLTTQIILARRARRRWPLYVDPTG